MMNFYKNLEAIDQPVSAVLANADFFKQIPDDWHVIVADITDSTQAIKIGKHTDVNLVAAGSLISALNVAKSYQVEIPYFFGGDGGIVIVPATLKEKVIDALNAHRINSYKNLQLDLCIGSMPMSEITAAGFVIRIAKVAITSQFHKAVVVGSGLKYAEREIKASYKKLSKADDFFSSTNMAKLNLEGLECRWNTIKPRREGLEVVCYLVEATDPKLQLEIYSGILKKMEEAYGTDKVRHPLSTNKLKLVTSLKKFQREMKAKYHLKRPLYILKLLFQSILGRFYFKYNLKINNLKGGDYLSQVIAYADTLTIDGRINTIVSGSVANRERFIDFLNIEEAKGTIIYGHHISSESIMTCYIEDMNNKHTHFVDGADGGYTEAAKQLKSKFMHAD